MRRGVLRRWSGWLVAAIAAGSCCDASGPDARGGPGAVWERAADAVVAAWGRAAGCVRRAADDAVEEGRAAHARTQGLFVYDAAAGDAAGSLGPGWRRPREGDRMPSAVLLVHGLDEPGGIWGDAAPALARAGFSVVRFEYPNDQHPSRSADGLADGLRELRRSLGVRRAVIVGHSMGGLIAYDVLTAGAPGGGGSASRPAVPALVTLGSPFEGSPLARLSAAAELRDHAERFVRIAPRRWSTLLGSLADGGREAAGALTPGSAYLAELAGRGGPPAGTRWTAVVGRVAPIGGDPVSSRASGWLDALPESLGALRSWGERAAEAADAQARDAARAVGDGVVPTCSAMAAPAHEHVVVDRDHRSMIRRSPAAAGLRRAAGLEAGGAPPGVGIVLDRAEASLRGGPTAGAEVR